QFCREKAQRGTGHCDGPLIAHHVSRLSFGIRVQTPGLQTGITDELADFGRSFQNRVRPELGQVPVASNRLNDPTYSTAAFIKRDGNAPPLQVEPYRKPGYSAAYDRY